MATFTVLTPEHKLWFLIDQVGLPVNVDQDNALVEVTVKDGPCDGPCDGHGMRITNTFSGHNIYFLAIPDSKTWKKMPAGVYEVASNVPGGPKAQTVISLLEKY